MNRITLSNNDCNQETTSALDVSVNISSQNLSDNSEWQARHIDI